MELLAATDKLFKNNLLYSFITNILANVRYSSNYYIFKKMDMLRMFLILKSYICIIINTTIINIIYFYV